MAEATTKGPKMIPAGRLGMGNWTENWSPDIHDRTLIEKKWVNSVTALVPPSGKINVVDASSGNGNSFLSFAKELTTDNHLVTATLVDLQPDAFDKLSDTLQNPQFPKHLTVKSIIGSVKSLQNSN